MKSPWCTCRHLGYLRNFLAEHDQRSANKTARLIKNARFRYDASIEQVLFDPAKGRDQGRIMQLASCEYIRQGASVLITGPAGVGKSYISTALGYQACLSGLRVRYFNMNKLLEAMQMSRIEAKAAKFFDRMAEVDLLIIEDFGMRVLDGQQLLDFMEAHRGPARPKVNDHYQSTSS